MIDESGILSRSDTIELIKNKLYFSSTDPPEKRRQQHLPWIPFSIDESYVYTAFFADFGPLDLGLTCKFCEQIHEVITTAQEQKKFVVFFVSSNEHKRANCAVLILAYLILSLNYTVEQAYGPFIGIQPPFVTFRDAGFCINTFPITVLDTAKAIRKAKILNHINLKTFSIQNYQHLNKLQNGDISWVIPGKFVAFSGPVTKRRQISPGVFTLTPDQYVPLFRQQGITCVVRFNDKCYDRKVFLNNGIRHVDLFYEDGGNPSEGILQSFLQVCEQERGAIAVHCKAGLGRTGTNIAAYMMKHYGYTAREAIAWCRICRPGSIVGPQQQFLVSIETKMFHEGNQYRERIRGFHKDAAVVNAGRSGYASSNGTVASGATDPGDTSGRTTPLIFQGSSKTPVAESLFRKDGFTKKEGKLVAIENIQENSNNNTTTHDGGLPPRSNSNGHARPNGNNTAMNQFTTSSSPNSTLPPFNPNHAGVVTGSNNYHTQQSKNEFASSSRDSSDATQLSVSYESRSLKGYSSDIDRPRSSSNPVQPSSYSSSPVSSSNHMPLVNVRTSGSNPATQQQQQVNLGINTGLPASRNSGINSLSKGIYSTQKQTSTFVGQSNFNGNDADVRRSLQITNGSQNHRTDDNTENVVPISRKDSKLAWNEKDSMSGATPMKLFTSSNGTSSRGAFEATQPENDNSKIGSSVKFTRHNSPSNGYTMNSNNNQGTSSMPPIERPRSSSGVNKSHDFTTNRRTVITRV